MTMMLACVTAVVLISCSGAASAVTTPRLRENDLRGIATRHSNEFEPERVAGYFRLNRTHAAEMFYFYFQSRQNSDGDPLLIWLQGGPGGSSALAVFEENGPYQLTADGEVEEREIAWDVNSNIVFVDSPIGVGFSYSDDPRDRVFNESVTAADLLDFLEEFLHARPELKDRDFFVTGESYAGHYIPAFSHHLWRTNKAKPEGQRIKLRGLAIGDGVFNKGLQWAANSDYAKEKGLITPAQHAVLRQLWVPCKLGVRLCHLKLPGISDYVCRGAYAFCLATQARCGQYDDIQAMGGHFNYFDVRKKCLNSDSCYDFSDLERFLNKPETLAAFGIPPGRGWTFDNDTVYHDFDADQLLNYDQLLPPMMADGIRVMIYVGMEDFCANYKGQEVWLNALDWERASEWQATLPEVWEVDGERAGTVQAAEPLTYVKLDGSGHLVPMDQPKRALDMITRFTRSEDFSGRAPASLVAARRSITS